MGRKKIVKDILDREANISSNRTENERRRREFFNISHDNQEEESSKETEVEVDEYRNVKEMKVESIGVKEENLMDESRNTNVQCVSQERNTQDNGNKKLKCTI